METRDKDAGYTCTCCGQYVKRYLRSFNSNMALALICLYRHSGGKYVHVEELLQRKGYKRCGDFSYLRHYGLIEKKEGKREDGSKRNGYYKLTGRGIMFVEGNLEVHSKFYMFNNAMDGFYGETINILKALGKKFSYEELISENKVSVKEHTRNKPAEQMPTNQNKLFNL